ncbi:hypothetical protein QJS04_geneDACA008639 [Acorus gramineus]|uniref:Uncharacterized protein n=1 Tax=Acorus gramineus TaxID=55184 RepID=A0AAV9AI08_ACOGR|nr:hypothetical protein QJS04_geneDACA008639 [Acorus gramineus]
MASLELEQDFIPFSQFPASKDFGPDSSQRHINPSLHPILKAFGGLKHKRSKTKKGSFKITNSRNYSDQPLHIPIMNSWEQWIHRNHLVYFDRILPALLWAVEASPSKGKFTFSLHPTHPLSANCSYLNKTFGLMIGMKGVQGVRVSWKLSYQVHRLLPPNPTPMYYTNGTYEQGEEDGGGGEEGKVRHHQVVPEGVLIPKAWIDAWPLLNRDE